MVFAALVSAVGVQSGGFLGVEVKAFLRATGSSARRGHRKEAGRQCARQSRLTDKLHDTFLPLINVNQPPNPQPKPVSSTMLEVLHRQ
jgi:hypothetical protein